MTAFDGIAGAAHGPIGPDIFHLLALIRTQIRASIEALEERIERDVVLEVVEQPGVLHFKIAGRGRAMHEVVIFDAIEIVRGVRSVAHGEVEAGHALHPFDVGFKLAAHVVGNLADFGEGLGIAIAGHEREDEALPCIGGERVRRIGNDVDLAEGFNGRLNDGRTV